MPSYSGKFQYLATSGTVLNEGACKVSFDTCKFTLTPASGAAFTFDLADVDRVRPGEWDMGLDLYTEKRVILRQFGAAFSRMSGELEKTWRDRTLRALLLEDLEEVGRYEGAAAFNGTGGAGPAEVRIFKSNIAVLPKAGAALQWRLADVDSIAFDSGAYAFELARGNERLTLSKFAKKTDEFGARLRDTFDALRQQASEALRERFLFLDPDSLAAVAELMREGRSVRLSKLGEIDERLPDAIVRGAVTPALRPHFEWLRDKAGPAAVMTGFKFIRADEDEKTAVPEQAPAVDSASERDDAGESSTEGATEAQPLFFWFFFPIPAANMVAWEASTGSGRATYFFRLAPGADVEETVQRLTRALALVNFRREPVYLPDRSLEEQPRFHKYAIAARKIPDVRMLRASYAGRAIHSSVDAWKAQAEAILAGKA